MAKIIKRGDVWLVNLEPATYREIHKKRPALIISDNTIHQKTVHVIIIPISSQIPKIVGPEMIPVGKKEGLEKPSVILPLFVRSIDKERLTKKIGKLEKIKLIAVEEALKLILHLS